MVRRDAARTGRARAAEALPPPAAARLANISTRVEVGAGEGAAIPGIVIEAAGDAGVLARAVGPGLVAFGVSSPLPDPRLELRTGGVLVEANEGWGTSASPALIREAAVRRGAFALVEGGRDAALYRRLGAGAHTLPVASRAGAAGVVLVELYVDEAVDAPVQAVNLSTRGRVGVGDNVLILGFVVEGGPVRLLLRAVGPGLRDFGVGGVVERPVMRVFRGPASLHFNQGWRTSPRFAETTVVARQVGAFPLVDASDDSTVLEWFQPGSYTVQVSGADSTTGIALVELYRVP
jgi:hypothetical protein